MTLKDLCIIHTKCEDDASIITPAIGPAGIPVSLAYAIGKFNNGAVSNSGSKYFRYPKGVFNPNVFMVEYWFNTNVWTMTDGASSDGNWHSLWDWYISNSNRITIHIGNVGNPYVIWQDVVGGSAVPTLFTTGFTWDSSKHHIAFVFDRLGIGFTSDTRRVYLDKVLIGSSTVAVPNQTATGGNLHFLVRFFNTIPGNTFNGLYDNAKAYSIVSHIEEWMVTAMLNNYDKEDFPVAVKPIQAGLDPLMSLERVA